MSIYQQLSEMSDKFQIQKFPLVSIPATSSLKLLDYANTRIFLQFSWTSTTSAPLFFYPSDNVVQVGWPTLGQANFIEFWIEKHKSLCQSNWFCLNNNAGPINVGIVTINLKIVEAEYEDTVKYETSQS